MAKVFCIDPQLSVPSLKYSDLTCSYCAVPPVHCCIQSEVLFMLLITSGNALIKCGETEKQIGGAEREFIQSAAINFLTPFRNFLEGDFKTILVSGILFG